MTVGFRKPLNLILNAAWVKVKIGGGRGSVAKSTLCNINMQRRNILMALLLMCAVLYLPCWRLHFLRNPLSMPRGLMQSAIPGLEFGVVIDDVSVGSALIVATLDLQAPEQVPTLEHRQPTSL
jgi:hypothetical protein